MPEVADTDMGWPVVGTTPGYDGSIVSIRRDTLRGSDGDTFEREVVSHKGAVGIVALDDQGRVLIVTQYRHPARQRLVELPAGLLDKPGEDPLEAAKRELAEEGHIEADRWSVLLELMPSPGVSDETITVYLAEGVVDTAVPDGFVAQHEESTMTREWVPLADLVEAALDRRVKNAALVGGVLATWARRGLSAH